MLRHIESKTQIYISTNMIIRTFKIDQNIFQFLLEKKKKTNKLNPKFQNLKP